MSIVSPLICPQCKQVDKVEKVSSVYDRGRVTTTSNYRYGFEEIRGNKTQITPLAQRLAPPKSPEIPSQRRQSSRVGNFNLFGVIFLISLWLWFISQVRIMPVDFAIFSSVVLIGFSFLFLWIRRRNRKKQAELVGIEQQKVQEYEAALDRWKHSYFCQRCDRVFIYRKPMNNS